MSAQATNAWAVNAKHILTSFAALPKSLNAGIGIAGTTTTGAFSESVAISSDLNQLGNQLRKDLSRLLCDGVFCFARSVRLRSFKRIQNTKRFRRPARKL